MFDFDEGADGHFFACLNAGFEELYDNDINDSRDEEWCPSQPRGTLPCQALRSACEAQRERPLRAYGGRPKALRR